MNVPQILLDFFVEKYDLDFHHVNYGDMNKISASVSVGENKTFMGLTKSYIKLPFDLILNLTDGVKIQLVFEKYECPLCLECPPDFEPECPDCDIDCDEMRVPVTISIDFSEEMTSNSLPDRPLSPTSIPLPKSPISESHLSESEDFEPILEPYPEEFVPIGGSSDDINTF